MKRYVGILAALLVIFISAGCGSSEETTSDNKKDVLTIKTTLYPLQYFTERIAGEEAEVSSILPPGTNAHTYEPTTKEMVDMADADAFIYNGAGLESYASDISDVIKPEGVKIVEASKGIDLLKDTEEHHQEGEHEHEDHDHEHGDYNPHVWLDPVRSIQIAEHIKEMMIELKPSSEEKFNQNFEALKSELQELDKEFETLKDEPKKDIVVSHAAYGYWEERYGIHQQAIAGISSTNEPSQKELEELIHFGEKHDVNYVLFEQNVTPKVAEVVQKELGAKALRLHNLAVLTDEDIKNEEDYFTLMKHNKEVLKKALSQ
ncbi:zinc ABC transporter substrate-binding protein [Halobacillus salinarum]|uniref:Zinc ABC transporter substrate-binding protein n=1 Tax=Halobacillus salinarum TaxID=2932257 RepID=A0ABY4EHB0_9BACI|nr:zinc ABC transporter substrate-binding protein [Halobacillus salinarum]UOQ43838.1 zinc ABC transporter substrate-binding protein [Halobacillus salinarum]